MRPHPSIAAGTVAVILMAAPLAGQAGTRPGGVDAAAQVRSPAHVARFVLPATVVSGIPLAEVSGLAWDADAGRLYGVSDQGYLYHFRIRRNGDAIVSIELVSALRLVNPVNGAGKANADKRFNAEGLALRRGASGPSGGIELLVALEENPPRIARFGPSGTLHGYLPVPPPANDIRHFQNKGRGLESVVLHPRHGLMTAPEAPLHGHPAGLHTIYAGARQWSFTRYACGSRLKGLAVLPGGDLLVLERSRPSGSRQRQIASLRRVDRTACDARRVCEATLVAALAPGPQNFEGMTLLDAHHVLLASDNGGDAGTGTTFVLIGLP